MGRPREVTDEQILAVARRCFLTGGASVSAVDIAQELGVSHTTLFNRFGSKEGLMLAALGPPREIPWVKTLEGGPDARPLRLQLVELAQVLSAYFQELHAGLGVLKSAGLSIVPVCRANDGSVPPPIAAYRALLSWLEQARREGRLAPCNLETLSATLLSSLQGWSFTTQICGVTLAAGSSDRYVEQFIGLLWGGIEPRKPRSGAAPEPDQATRLKRKKARARRSVRSR